MTTAGLLLAAGAGTRMGRPKALLREPDGRSWLLRSANALLDGGCAPVIVALGAAAEEALPLLDGTGATPVVAADWAEGMGASLRAGLRAVDATSAEAVLVTLVDLPDVDAAVVRRVVTAGAGPAALVRASYDGRAGHPVLLGRDHWAGVAAVAVGDRGARAYLAGRAVVEVECGDLATGHDVDTR